MILSPWAFIFLTGDNLVKERKAEARKMAAVLDPDAAQKKRALNKLELDQQLLLYKNLHAEDENAAWPAFVPRILFGLSLSYPGPNSCLQRPDYRTGSLSHTTTYVSNHYLDIDMTQCR